MDLEKNTKMFQEIFVSNGVISHSIMSPIPIILLRDREKGKFEMFYPTQNRNLNFPAAAAETFKGGDPRKVKPATQAETFKSGHPRKARPTSLPKET